MTDLPTVRYETLAGQQTSVRDLDVATQAADSSTAGNAQAASRGRDTVSTVGIDAAPGSGPAARKVRLAVPVVQRVAASGTGLRANDVILTTPPALTVPGNALFMVHAEPAARTLVETDPRFTSYRSFIGSDYFQQALKRDPEHQMKRYGDGFLEQRLIDDQVLALTGRRYIDGYSSTEAQYKALMDAGVAYAMQYQLSPGIALTAEQMALLTTDIVWLETRSVTLADGSSQQVIAPQVYLRRPIGGDLQPNGALMAGSDVQIKTEHDLVNSGVIAGKAVTVDAGGDLLNQGGRVSGQDIWMRASNDLQNLSGVITATGPGAKIALLAGRDIVLQTQASGSVSSRRQQQPQQRAAHRHRAGRRHPARRRPRPSHRRRRGRRRRQARRHGGARHQGRHRRRPVSARRERQQRPRRAGPQRLRQRSRHHPPGQRAAGQGRPVAVQAGRDVLLRARRSRCRRRRRAGRRPQRAHRRRHWTAAPPTCRP